tara:strand:- start:1636 stop:2370 length:735 start_codon:yes stop_codon:yes gene_type:complete
MSTTCIVIPCYNEAIRFQKNEFESFLNQNLTINFLLVDDGSTDDTSKMLIELSKKHQNQVSHLVLAKNKGKAEAVRQGIMNCVNKFDVVGFWDADFSTPLFEINNLMSCFESQSEVDFVFGSRVKRMGASIIRNPLRHYLGRVFSTLSSTIVRLPVYDSQCGAKLFTSKTANKLFEIPFKTKWLFDVELLKRYIQYFGKNKAIENVLEVPLKQWHEIAGSKLKMIDFIKVPFEMFTIHKNYNSK